MCYNSKQTLIFIHFHRQDRFSQTDDLEKLSYFHDLRLDIVFIHCLLLLVHARFGCYFKSEGLLFNQ
jgi:hypothetical protein